MMQNMGLAVCICLPTRDVKLKNYRNHSYPFCSCPARALPNARAGNLAFGLRLGEGSMVYYTLTGLPALH